MSDTERDIRRWKDEQLHMRGQCERGCLVCDDEPTQIPHLPCTQKGVEIMKCYNFLCDKHDTSWGRNCSNYDAWVESCKSRKRYNRIIKHRHRNGGLVLFHFNDERDKYYGRGGYHDT
ncbi:hypothetical protein LCGC14_1081220 [marine sediment metagenome]|uniref:Uncharacterized protein n=1 Tax=marine sediment metagenome TaxID=412755 RepID=A0A0F9MJZ1_9ZZZZ